MAETSALARERAGGKGLAKESGDGSGGGAGGGGATGPARGASSSSGAAAGPAFTVVARRAVVVRRAAG
ncbi:MAG: hypothetical protein ACK6AD_09120 [Cyanobacteriota bacterium]